MTDENVTFDTNRDVERERELLRHVAQQTERIELLPEAERGDARAKLERFVRRELSR